MTLAQSKERKESNFAIWQPCLQVGDENYCDDSYPMNKTFDGNTSEIHIAFRTNLLRQVSIAFVWGKILTDICLLYL